MPVAVRITSGSVATSSAAALPMRPMSGTQRYSIRTLPSVRSGGYAQDFATGYTRGVRDRERVRPIGIEQYYPLAQKSKEYGGLYAAFSDGKHDRSLEQELRRSAAKFGDQYMINILNTQGLQGGAYYVGWLDAMTKPEAVTRPGN